MSKGINPKLLSVIDELVKDEKIREALIEYFMAKGKCRFTHLARKYGIKYTRLYYYYRRVWDRYVWLDTRINLFFIVK